MAKRKHRPKGERPDHGTPETARKLRPDPLLTLLHRDLIDDDQHGAALAIAAGYRLIVGPVALRISDPGRPPIRGHQEAETHAAIMLQRRYCDWADAMDERARATRHRRPNPWAIGPILDICVEGMSCREVEARRGLARGAARQQLVDALDLYNEVARRSTVEGRRERVLQA